MYSLLFLSCPYMHSLSDLESHTGWLMGLETSSDLLYSGTSLSLSRLWVVLLLFIFLPLPLPLIFFFFFSGRKSEDTIRGLGTQTITTVSLLLHKRIHSWGKSRRENFTCTCAQMHARAHVHTHAHRHTHSVCAWKSIQWNCSSKFFSFFMMLVNEI